jgi:hypothetical protein
MYQKDDGTREDGFNLINQSISFVIVLCEIRCMIKVSYTHIKNPFTKAKIFINVASNCTALDFRSGWSIINIKYKYFVYYIIGEILL